MYDLVISPSSAYNHSQTQPIMSSTQYKVGDKVSYHAIGGGNVPNSETTGEIVDVLTETAPAGSTGNTVEASDTEPRYVIKNDNTGKNTAYKAANIVKKH